MNSSWRYTTEDNRIFSEPSFDDLTWARMPIPCNWYLNGLDHHGVVWFRREFQIRPRSDQLSLRFDGVDYFSDVFLNGELLGHHTGYFDPFEFDVTEKIRSRKCKWHLSGGEGSIAFAPFHVNIPADAVSTEIKSTLPSLPIGRYKLSVEVSAKGNIIGENWYELKII